MVRPLGGPAGGALAALGGRSKVAALLAVWSLLAHSRWPIRRGARFWLTAGVGPLLDQQHDPPASMGNFLGALAGSGLAAAAACALDALIHLHRGADSTDGTAEELRRLARCARPIGRRAGVALALNVAPAPSLPSTGRATSEDPEREA